MVVILIRYPSLFPQIPFLLDFLFGFQLKSNLQKVALQHLPAHPGPDVLPLSVVPPVSTFSPSPALITWISPIEAPSGSKKASSPIRVNRQSDQPPPPTDGSLPPLPALHVPLQKCHLPRFSPPPPFVILVPFSPFLRLRQCLADRARRLRAAHPPLPGQLSAFFGECQATRAVSAGAQRIGQPLVSQHPGIPSHPPSFAHNPCLFPDRSGSCSWPRSTFSASATSM